MTMIFIKCLFDPEFRRAEVQARRKISILKKIVRENVPDLISMMLIGTRAFNNEIQTKSDIDISLLVRSDADKIRKLIVEKLRNNYPELEHIHTWILVQNISDFYILPRRTEKTKNLIWNLRYHRKYGNISKLLMGKRIDFNKFPIKPLSLYDEAKTYLDYNCYVIKFMLNNSYTVPKRYEFSKVLKNFIKLSAIDYQYAHPDEIINTSEYLKIQSLMNSDIRYLVDLAIEYRERSNTLTEIEKRFFVNFSMSFLSYFEDLLRKLK